MDKQQSKPIESLSFEELFQMAQEKFQELDLDEAEYFYSLAYQKNPHNEAVVMCYASILKQNDKVKEAKKVLEKSIKDYPNGTYKRYFQLGEIYHGVEAIKAFETGINQALKSLKNPFKNVTPQHETKRDIAQAYASIAEICMTDLIDEPQAEPKCIQALKKGNEIDPSCMDVHLQTANYQLWKENEQLAGAELNIIYTAVKGKNEQYETELIIQASKYLIELQQYQKSGELLQTIHEQQSNESEIVYLLAYCAFKQQKYEQCEDYIEEYQDSVNNIKDEEIQQAMSELIVQLKKFKKTNKVSEEMGQNEENFQDDEWMDVEDEDN